jgi:hypothetical protein
MSRDNVVSLRGRPNDKRRNLEPSKRPDFNLEESFADLGIKSFRQEYRRLSKMVGDNDFSSSKTSYAATRSLFAMMVNFVPQLEENCHRWPNEKSAYAMAAIVSSIRELAHDLQSYGDQSAVVERVRQDVIQPMLSSLASSVVSDFLKLRKKLHSELPPKTARHVDRELDEFQRNLTSVFAQVEATAAERLATVLKT